MGLKCGAVTLGRYADGEVMVQLDEHVRGKGGFESVRLKLYFYRYNKKLVYAAVQQYRRCGVRCFRLL